MGVGVFVADLVGEGTRPFDSLGVGVASGVSAGDSDAGGSGVAVRLGRLMLTDGVGKDEGRLMPPLDVQPATSRPAAPIPTTDATT